MLSMILAETQYAMPLPFSRRMKKTYFPSGDTVAQLVLLPLFIRLPMWVAGIHFPLTFRQLIHSSSFPLFDPKGRFEEKMR